MRQQIKQQPMMIIIIIMSLLALVIKLFIASTTIGTNDIFYWMLFYKYAMLYGGTALYHAIQIFNHPPLMIHVICLWGWLARITHLSFPLVLRSFGIIADFLSVFCLYSILRHQRIAHSTWSFFLMILSPIAIMISGFHGNTDPIMIFFVILSIYFLQQSNKLIFLILAGCALGIATNIKIVPLLFYPAFFFSIDGFKQKFVFFVVTGIVFLIGGMPYLAQDPLFILHRLITYNGIYGHWGISHLLQLSHIQLFNILYFKFAKFVLILLIIIFSFVLNRRSYNTPLLTQCAFIMFLFFCFTPSFALQYLVWLIPFTVILSTSSAVLLNCAGGLFLFMAYTYWSQGFPWHYANSLATGDWAGPIKLLELATWAIVVWCWAEISYRIFRSNHCY